MLSCVTRPFKCFDAGCDLKLSPILLFQLPSAGFIDMHHNAQLTGCFSSLFFILLFFILYFF